ncbi:FAD/NAD(P)-binding domain protein [Raphanus sativus]|nr:FAD/NAD(P)-binding domain protein [Raphanus sativus]
MAAANMTVISSSSALLSRRLRLTTRANGHDLLQREASKRVVVCGGGVIGVCTAYFLAKKGILSPSSKNSPWSGKLEMLSSVFRVYGTKAHSIVLEPKEPNAVTLHALFLTYHPSNGGRAFGP